jgi:hypothetical protein
LALSSADAAIAAALRYWQHEGADVAMLGGVSFVVTDLADGLLALADGMTVYLDADAAGFGWSLNAQGRVADGRIDLASVLIHELGHVLGLDHDEAAGSVMHETLGAGTRLFPANVAASGSAMARTTTVSDAAQTANLASPTALTDLPVRTTSESPHLSPAGVSAVVEFNKSYADAPNSNGSAWYAGQSASEGARTASRIAEALDAASAAQVSTITFDEFELFRRTAFSLPLSLLTR